MEKEGASSPPKGVTKGMSKRKSDEKDDRLLKKGPGIPVGDKRPKQPSLPKPVHEAGKGLMTKTDLVTQGAVHQLLTHKEHAVEMIKSIIKDTDLDPCAEQLTKDLGASGLFDLARVCFSYILLYFMLAS